MSIVVSCVGVASLVDAWAGSIGDGVDLLWMDVLIGVLTIGV